MTLAQQSDIITAGLIVASTFDLIAGIWFVCAFYAWVGRKIRARVWN
jgi:hypothetical protein